MKGQGKRMGTQELGEVRWDADMDMFATAGTVLQMYREQSSRSEGRDEE